MSNLQAMPSRSQKEMLVRGTRRRVIAPTDQARWRVDCLSASVLLLASLAF